MLLILEREEVGEGGREGRGETERERHGCERKTLTGCLLYTPQLGIGPETQVCALTGNRTRNLLM